MFEGNISINPRTTYIFSGFTAAAAFSFSCLHMFVFYIYVKKIEAALTHLSIGNMESVYKTPPRSDSGLRDGDFDSKQTLKLTLSKKPFEIMITGEKTEEFREVKKWVTSRLYNKDGSKKEYKYVKFTNGYGGDRPYFVCIFNRTYIGNHISRNYSNNLKLSFENEIYVIELGDIIKKGNDETGNS